MSKTRLPSGEPADNVIFKLPVETHQAMQMELVRHQLSARKMVLLGIASLLLDEKQKPGTLARINELIDQKLDTLAEERNWLPIFEEIIGKARS